MEDILEKWVDPVFFDTYRHVPASLAARLTEMADETGGGNIYYERVNVLLALAYRGEGLDPSTVQLDEPPSDEERRLGSAIGQAFHQGCKLADVALATGLPPNRVIEIGKRTIRRTKWLDRIDSG